ncbi:MAG: hypothetical protein H7329_01820 [Opitutaceae bacterium]|nr:hypothetical protein [Cytophagales bacterium]
MTDKFIYSVSSYKNGELSFNGNAQFKSLLEPTDERLNECFQKLGISYPKFFKMDPISKTGFLCTELLVKNNAELIQIESSQVAVLVNTFSGSFDSDIKFQETIQSTENYFPSPGLFVYTLPNIVIGEICIRNGFKGENLCLLSERPEIDQIFVTISAWINSGLTEVTICGWIEVKNDQSHATLILVGKDKEKRIADFTKENLRFYFTESKQNNI